MTAAYARHSSRNQREESIEGQVKVIKAWADKNGYTITREYIDRMRTGTNDKRTQLQKILEDSKKGLFGYVIVYALDRFGRNLKQSIDNEYKLQKNNVVLLSATEEFKDNPAGRLHRNMLLSFAQYYSDELSEKIKRGTSISIEKRKSIGSSVPLGYSLTDDKHYEINPATSPIVQKCFNLYSAGSSLKEIGTVLINEHGLTIGNVYNYVGKILGNENYIGTYTRGGSNIPDAIPAIVSKDLFNKVQIMRSKKKKTPASSRAYEEYLMTTKLFCGSCGAMMVGTGGTSKTGKVYHYYGCKGVINKKGCKKKNVHKSFIEDFVIAKALEQLTDDNINLIAKAVSEISKAENNSHIIIDLKRQLRENAAALENLLKAIESGQHIELLSNRITKNEEKKSTLEKMLALEQMNKTSIDENEVKFFLHQLKKGYIRDIAYKRALISIFINKVYLYDDRVRIIFNASDRPVEIDYELLEEIAVLENGGIIKGGRCSYLMECTTGGKTLVIRVIARVFCLQDK